MAGVNKVILIGNTVEKPSIRYAPQGAAVANFTIATNETWKDKAGEKKEKVEFHRVVAFGRLAEISAEYLDKGRQVYVEGKLVTRKWQDKEGKDRYTTEVVASTMQMLGAKEKGEVSETSGGNTVTDDIPF